MFWMIFVPTIVVTVPFFVAVYFRARAPGDATVCVFALAVWAGLTWGIAAVADGQHEDKIEKTILHGGIEFDLGPEANEVLRKLDRERFPPREKKVTGADIAFFVGMPLTFAVCAGIYFLWPKVFGEKKGVVREPADFNGDDPGFDLRDLGSGGARSSEHIKEM